MGLSSDGSKQEEGVVEVVGVVLEWTESELKGYGPDLKGFWPELERALVELGRAWVELERAEAEQE